MVSVAIDGPAGAGKSTVAKGVSKNLGFIYVDTGALYRAIGVAAEQNNVDLESKEDVKKFLNKTNVRLGFVDGEQRVFLNDLDITNKIRTPKASMMASKVSAISEVRDFLFNLQRDIAKDNNVIMDGRDIGTVILPNADLKIFLIASPEERAQRRYRELLVNNSDIVYEEVLRDIKERDYNDSNRDVAPLVKADDAVEFDTTGLKLEESIEKIERLVRERVKW